METPCTCMRSTPDRARKGTEATWDLLGDIDVVFFVLSLGGSILTPRRYRRSRLPRWTLGPIRNWRRAATGHHWRCSTIFYWTNIWPLSGWGTVRIVKSPKRRRATVGHVTGWELCSVGLRYVKVVRPGCWCTHRGVMGPSSRCEGR